MALFKSLDVFSNVKVKKNSFVDELKESH